MLLIAVPAFATVSVKRNADDPKKIDVAIKAEPLSSAVKALQPYLPHRVEIIGAGDAKTTFSAKHVDPEAALHAAALSAGVSFAFEDDRYILRRPPTVTLDVKDQDIHTILKTMQKQCAIKNLVVDPDVQGKGTFLFDGVPCHKAFDVVFTTMGLASVDYGNSVVTVGKRQ